MSTDRISVAAERLLAARRQGARITLPESDAPRTFEEAFEVQDRVVAGLGQPTIGWKGFPVPGGPVIFAPLLESGRVPANGTWTLTGHEPAGLELEIAFVMGRDVAPDATPEEIVAAIDKAYVVFELCQSRFNDFATLPKHLLLADCVANFGVAVGPEIPDWRSKDLKARPGRLLVDGKVHIEGKSVNPIGAIQTLAPALAARNKKLKAGQIVITGSLIGMNWITGRHDLKGVIDGLGEVEIKLVAA